MKAVTEDGLRAVLFRLRDYPCHSAESHVDFENLEGSVTFSLHCYEQTWQTNLPYKRYAVGVLVNLQWDEEDEIPHQPAVSRWVDKCNEGDTEVYSFGPLDENLCYVGSKKDAISEIMTKVRHCQALKICSCSREVYFDNAELCLSCQLTATPSDLGRVHCCVCQSDAFSMHCVKVKCCSHRMHRGCYAHVTSAVFGDRRMRCPLCRGNCVLQIEGQK